MSAAEKWNKKKNLHEHDRKQMYAHKHTQIFKLSTLEDQTIDRKLNRKSDSIDCWLSVCLALHRLFLNTDQL